MISFHSLRAAPSVAFIVLLNLHNIFFLISSIDALFITPPSKIVPYPSLNLATADRLGISYYAGIAQDAGKAASLPGFALSLNAEFGTLSEKAFSQLQNKYCSWSDTKSQVSYYGMPIENTHY